MALYQKSVLNKYLEGLDQTKVDAAYQKFSAKFHDPAFQLNIRKAKEEQYQEGFLNDLFVNVLGYIKNPEPNYNLTTEFKNIKNSKKADGAILVKGKAIAVIELKGMNTPNLDKVESQAFGYKSNQPDAVYVITANFEKLRFYIDNAVDYIEWNLFNLTREQFNEVWLCLAQESILSGLPKEVKEASVIEEKTITERLYKDYSTFRNELYHSISKKNPDIDPLLLFKKTQKLLDRFLFIFFAEDRLLVPPNSIARIIDRWKQLEELDNYKPLYDIFQQYFGYFNNGRKGKKSIDDIFAYNGGLFKPDAILDKLKIDDYVLFKHTQTLTKYDFVSEVDVNILGHIFEHSLNDIEEINAQLEGEKLDKSKTKRKKDGVFYTPKYITKYIVENTVGKLCEEKKTELGIVDIDFSKTYMTKRKRTNKDGKKTFLSVEGENIYNSLNQYRDYLLNLTICDPACGSGAFLNQAFNFLIDEHENIDQYHASLRGDILTLTDVTKDILEKNLFGVDINQEAVEIAKLSLWLRTAQKGRKLNNLNENIKCGNSLIDDPEVAGEKAFSWETEFPEVFKNGGFDVVIGNPPYGAKISKFKNYLSSNFQTFSKGGESYILFVEQSTKILKLNGELGFIIPDTYLDLGFTESTRTFLLRNTLVEQIIVLPSNVFESATVDTTILIYKKQAYNSNYHLTDVQIKIFGKKHLKVTWGDYLKEFTISTKIWHEENSFLVLSDTEEIKLLRKINSSFEALSNYVEMFSGVKYYEVGKGNPPQTSKIRDEKPFTSNYKIDEDWSCLYEGKDIERYALLWNQNNWIKYGDWLAAPRKLEYFEGEKILIRKIIGATLKAQYIEHTSFCNTLLFILKVKPNIKLNYLYILGVLNSKFIGWYFRKRFQISFNDTFPQIMIRDILQFPIPYLPKEKQVKKLANIMIQKNKDLNAIISKFQRLINRKFNIEKLPKKLQNWHTLTFNEFTKELKKKKIKLGLVEEAEWEDYFETEKAKAQAIQTVIDKTDREIDQMVYGLYGLTEEEIKIVENS